MGCLGYILLGLVIIYLVTHFSLGYLLLALIVGWLFYKIFLD